MNSPAANMHHHRKSIHDHNAGHGMHAAHDGPTGNKHFDHESGHAHQPQHATAHHTGHDNPHQPPVRTSKGRHIHGNGD